MTMTITDQKDLIAKLQASTEVATTEKAGIVQLNDTATSTATNQAATANQIKILTDNKAPLASPAFTGTPTVPTAATDINNTQSASTAFVNNLFNQRIISGDSIRAIDRPCFIEFYRNYLPAAEQTGLPSGKYAGYISIYQSNLNRVIVITSCSTGIMYQMLMQEGTWTNWLLVNPIIDNLTSTSTTASLSANQGKVLNDQINALVEVAPSAKTLTNMTYNGLPIYKQRFTGNYPSSGGDVVLVSSGVNNIYFPMTGGSILRKTPAQYHNLMLLFYDAPSGGHIGPIYMIGGVINLYGMTSDANYTGQPYDIVVYWY